jgi:hypothetical protein
VYFATGKGAIAVLMYTMKQSALESLLGAGAILGPIPAVIFGGSPIPIEGLQLFIPPNAFSLFNELVLSGQITVVPIDPNKMIE